MHCVSRDWPDVWVVIGERTIFGIKYRVEKVVKKISLVSAACDKFVAIIQKSMQEYYNSWFCL